MAGLATQYGFGSGLMYGIRNDISGATPVRLGVLQDVSIDFDGELKELYGQLQYPVDVARGKSKITGKAKFALLQAGVYNSLYFGQTLATGQKAFAYNEALTISTTTATGTTSAASTAGSTTLTFSAVPAGVVAGMPVSDTTAAAAIPAGTYVVSKTATTVTLSQAIVTPGVGSGDTIAFAAVTLVANAATFAQDLGVYYSNTGEPLTLVTTLTAAGQYTVNAVGGYSFYSADSTAALLANYTYTSTSGNEISGTNPLMGNTPTFQMVFNQLYKGRQTVLTLYSCVSNKLNFATKIDDYVIPEFDFMAYANAAGQVFDFSLAN